MSESEASGKTKAFYYLFLSFIFWVIVEYITAWNTRVSQWISLMPWILFQYIFIILIFALFLFKFKWNEKKVFIVMLVVMYIFEFLWQNYLLLNLVLFIPGSLLLISIWGFLTFIPLWILTKSLKTHKKAVIIFSLWMIVALFFLFLNFL